ncbi:MAG TPA: ankyrin repeat domain-containing protein, partial [Gammaproteobacteria bacterium]|nr:ankyrin repeat domain-containing protein [Gammaproteobacteria bacterium]
TWNTFKADVFTSHTTIKGTSADQKEQLFYSLVSEPILKPFLGTARTISTGLFTQRSYTPLQYAARYNCLECMKFFIDLLEERQKKIFLNQANEQGETLLHIAARYGSNDIVAYLVNQNVSISSDIDGNTPLHLAAKHNRLEIVNMLKTRIDPQTKNLALKTPLVLTTNDDIKTALRINHSAVNPNRVSVDIDLKREQAKRSASQCYVMHFINKRIKTLETETQSLGFYSYYDYKVKSAKMEHLKKVLAIINAANKNGFNFQNLLASYKKSNPAQYAEMIKGGFMHWGSKKTFNMMQNLMTQTPPNQITQRDQAINQLQARMSTLERELSSTTAMGADTKRNKINAIVKLITFLQDPLYFSSSVKDAIGQFEHEHNPEYKALIAGLSNNDSLALINTLKTTYGNAQALPTCLDYEEKLLAPVLALS